MKYKPATGGDGRKAERAVGIRKGIEEGGGGVEKNKIKLPKNDRKAKRRKQRDGKRSKYEL